MTRNWHIAVVCLVFGTLLGWRGYHNLIEAGDVVNQGVSFYDLPPRVPASFSTHGATRLHVISYFVLTAGSTLQTNYSLQISFRSRDGIIHDRQVAHFSIDSREPLPFMKEKNGALARSRWLTLHMPKAPDTAVVQIESPESHVLLHVNRISDRIVSREEVLERIGIPPFLLAADELLAIVPQGYTPVPAREVLPSIKLPPTVLVQDDGPSPEEAPWMPPSALRFGPHHALVFNVVGPGVMTVVLTQGKGRFQVEHIGVASAVPGREVSKDGRVSVKLPVGPSSVLVRPLGETTGTVRLTTNGVRTLGGSDAVLESSVRQAGAWRVDRERALRFPLYERKAAPIPLRLTARALDAESPKPLRWRFLDAQNGMLLEGTLLTSAGYDPFTEMAFEGQVTEIAVPSPILLSPPRGAAFLELVGEGVLVEVDTLLETGAHPAPVPPFDIPLVEGLRWQDVPVQGPRWLMLQPLGTHGEKHRLYATLLLKPRIEPFTFESDGPWVSLAPREFPERSRVIEPTKNPASEQRGQAFALPQKESEVLVLARGKHARRIILTCEVKTGLDLGGQLALFLDGQKAASRPIVQSSVRLEVSASPGVHRVRVSGADSGSCTSTARPPSGVPLVRRGIYLLPKHKGLGLTVKAAGKRPLRLHYVLYAEDAGARQKATIMATVDGGAPRRRAGSFANLTSGQANKEFQLAPADLPSNGSQPDRRMRQVGVGAVQLGDDLHPGRHRIRLRALSPGRYWVRFFISGTPPYPGPAETWTTTELAQAQPVGMEE